jgi:rod shape-determining protein MreC
VLDFDGSRRARQREAAISLGIFLLSLVIFALPDSYQTPLRQFMRNTILRPFVQAQASLASRRARSMDVGEIRAQRDSLIAVTSALATLAEENRRLRELQNLRTRSGPAFIPAEVLTLGVTTGESQFMLNVGRAEGVQVNSPVIAPEGLLGIITDVDEHTSLGRDWTHEDFRASAMTVDGDAQGIVEVRRGRFREEDMMALNGAPFHIDIPQGKLIVTTGKGGKIPRGIPLGVVIGIEEADTGWRKSYLLRPAVRPEVATTVLVATTDQSGSDLSQLWHVTPAKPPAAPPDSAPRPRRTPRRDTTTTPQPTPPVPPPTTTTGSW